MADGQYRFQTGAGSFFYPQHSQNSHHSHRLQRAASPVNSGLRAAFNTDTPSPSRSPGSQSPAHSTYNMFNHSNQHNQHGMLNGQTGPSRFGMPLGVKQQYQQQNHHNQGHHQHNQELGSTHGGGFGGHQHNLSGGGLSNAAHFHQTHIQNGTPGSSHGHNKATTAHWVEQQQGAARARDMTISHAHARNNQAASKQNLVSANNGATKETDKIERNRSILQTEDDQEHVWTTLDFGGQSLRSLSESVFCYTFLTKLYANSNKLTEIPGLIGQCRHLQVLDFSLNELQTLPPEIGMLTNLKELLLFDNKLTHLPEELGSLHKLEMLGVEGNPSLDEENLSIIRDQENGTVKLITYFRETAQGPEPPLSRSWAMLDESHIPVEDKFTVLNYNTLCDKYATQSQYGYTPSKVLAWEHRKEAILNELRDYKADIMCLQEIDDESFNEYFRPSLAEDDYKGVFYQKGRARTMGGLEARSVDGCATFYRHEKFILLDKQTINFSQIAINRPDMKGEHAIFNRVMARDDVALVVFLENRLTGARLMVVNLHVFWNPEFADVKVVQIAILMSQLENLAEKYTTWPALENKKLFAFASAYDEDDPRREEPQEPAPSQVYPDKISIPIVMGGDYNSLANSGVYELIAKGSLPPDHRDFRGHTYGNFTKDGISHPFNLKSSYGAIGELSFTNYTPDFTGVIDYIWYSTGSLQVVKVLGDVDKEYLKRVPGFPNYHFPSDHLALLSEFMVKGKKKVVEADFGTQNHRDRR